MNRIDTLHAIKTPPAWKERLLERAGRKSPGKRRVFSRAAVTAAAVLLLGLLSGTALAMAEGGFFAGFFARQAESRPDAQAYMDLSQLPALAGATVGTAADTDELRIDVMEVLASGTDAVVALRVTAKELDTVLRDNGWEDVPLNNYRFGSDNGGTLFEEMTRGSIQYVYCDQDSSLAANQFYLILAVSAPDNFSGGPYTLELRSLGYYGSAAAEGVRSGIITTVYPGPWTISLDLSGDTDHSRTLFLGQSITIGTYEYCIEDISLTPFSFSAVVTYEGEPDTSSQRFQEFWQAASDLSFVTAEGITVEGTSLSAGGGSDHSPAASYQVGCKFQVPVDVTGITGIHIFGQDYPLPPLAPRPQG